MGIQGAENEAAVQRDGDAILRRSVWRFWLRRGPWLPSAPRRLLSSGSNGFPWTSSRSRPRDGAALADEWRLHQPRPVLSSSKHQRRPRWFPSRLKAGLSAAWHRVANAKASPGHPISPRVPTPRFRMWWPWGCRHTLVTSSAAQPRLNLTSPNRIQNKFRICEKTSEWISNHIYMLLMLNSQETLLNLQMSTLISKSTNKMWNLILNVNQPFLECLSMWKYWCLLESQCVTHVGRWFLLWIRCVLNPFLRCLLRT